MALIRVIMVWQKLRTIIGIFPRRQGLKVDVEKGKIFS